MKVRKVSMTKRMIAVIIGIMLIGVFILGGVVSGRVSSMIKERIRAQGMDIAACAAAEIDPMAIASLRPGDEDSQTFSDIHALLTRFRDSSSILFIYTMGFDDAGNLVYLVDSDPDDPAELFEAAVVLPSMREAAAGKVAADEDATSDEWGTYISSYAPIFLNGKVVAMVGADYEYSAVQKEIRTILITLLSIFAAVIVCMVVAVLLIGRRLKSGFTTLNDKLAELADGSGNLDNEVSITTGDEFEVIAGTVNAFIKQIRTLVGQVSTVSSSNATTLREVNDRIMTVSASMEECSSSTDAVTNNLAGASTGVEELASNIGRVEQIAATANVQATEGSALAVDHEQTAGVRIEKINKEIESALEDARNVEEVRKIANRIQDIATQTKLLSLNAQIEASHAGQSGRGFAVVATEVQELSIKIADAVGEISDLSDGVVGAMNKLTDSVGDMVEFMTGEVSEDYKAFAKLGEDYGRTVSMISEEMTGLKNQSNEISVRVSDVNTSIGEINHAVLDSANQINAITESSVRIGESMNSLMEIPILKR